MRLTTLDEASIQAIGHAFGYYDYGKETGMGAACSSPDKTALYICGFVRAMLAAGLLYTTSERGEAFIAYRLPGEKVKLTAFFPLLKGVFQAMTFRELCRFARLMKRAGASLNDRYDKEKKPHIYVGLVCVTEKYQGQGYMREGVGDGVRGRQPPASAGYSGNGRKVEMQQVCAFRDGTGWHTRRGRTRHTLRPHQVSG